MIANGEVLYKMQSKESPEKEYVINNILYLTTRTTFAQARVLGIANVHVFSISYVFDLLENECLSILQANCTLTISVLALEYNMVFYI